MTGLKRLVSLPGGWPAESPPRSAFFGLSPAGHNGESFEGLSSYFRRLSAHHRILPRSLARRAVVPLFTDHDTKYQEWLGLLSARRGDNLARISLLARRAKGMFRDTE
jgi:hypothetical protein